jgi:methylmalonyl-CoA mutase cobalamin-binding subunit
LAEAGIEVSYMGREASPSRIAKAAVDARADAVEFCVVGGGGVVLLRDTLRELKQIDRRRVSIVVHRLQ